MPPTDTEETTPRESSETPKEEATTPRDTSTRSTLTTPFREPRVLSKIRLEPKIEKIRDKPTAKVRTVLASKNVGRLTTTRSRETTILPTSSFRTRGNVHEIVVLYLSVIKLLHNYDYSFIIDFTGGFITKDNRPETFDPCLSSNHKIIKDQPNRSFNRHLSQVTLSDASDARPICDQLLEPGWYRFVSPAGNLMPTECPGGKYCGTNMPIWMKGIHSIHYI